MVVRAGTARLDRMDARETVRPLLRVRQVREFTDTPVEAAALDAIADAGRWSGSSKNGQPWRFIIVSRREILARIADAGQPQSRSLATAPVAIAIAMPHVEGAGIVNAFDEGRAAERMLVAASLLELGAAIAWLRADVRPMVAELLGLPEGRFVRTMLAIGHPADAAARPKSGRGQARLPRHETVFVERIEPERIEP